MNSTIFLAQFWGWLLVIMGAVYLLNKKEALQNLFKISDDQDFLASSGYLSLVIGLVTVILHNVWSGDYIVVTVFGWIAVIKGVIRLWMPGWVTKWVKIFSGQLWIVRIMLIVLILLGLRLIQIG